MDHAREHLTDASSSTGVELALADRVADLFHAAFMSARDAMLIADDQARYIEANPAACELLARSRDELLTMTVFDVSPSGVDADGAWRSFLEQGDVAGEYVIERPDGSTVDVEFRATANILDGLHLSIMRDVTERKRLERESAVMQRKLQRARRVESLGVLATGVAHDFNTIMARVRGHIDLLRGDLDDLDQRSHPSVEAINAALDEAMQVTERLLAFGGRKELERHTVHVNTIVEQVRPLVEPLLGPDVELVLDLNDDHARVAVDDQIQQVLLSLVSNARDAMPHGGRLTISTDVRDVGGLETVPGLVAGRYAVLRVADTGVGMDQETREHALDPFFTTKSSWSPSGLGLSTAYGIVTQLGGSMTIDSTPGQGTTVTLLLPASDHDPS